jgi:hypothetical protein
MERNVAMPRKYKIAVLPGDGVGREVVPEAVKALEAAQESVAGFELVFEEHECGFEYYQDSGEPWGSPGRRRPTRRAGSPTPSSSGPWGSRG